MYNPKPTSDECKSYKSFKSREFDCDDCPCEDFIELHSLNKNREAREQAAATIETQRDALLEACEGLLLHIGLHAIDRIGARDEPLVKARAAIALCD